MNLSHLINDALLAQGLTQKEIEAFEATCDSANLTLSLPDIHPMDRAEFCSAYHVIQDKILARAAVKAIRGTKAPAIFGETS